MGSEVAGYAVAGREVADHDERRAVISARILPRGGGGGGVASIITLRRFSASERCTIDPTRGVRRFPGSGFAGEGFGGDSSSLDRSPNNSFICSLAILVLTRLVTDYLDFRSERACLYSRTSCIFSAEVFTSRYAMRRFRRVVSNPVREYDGASALGRHANRLPLGR